MCGSDRQVSGLNAESQVVGDVVGGLELTVGVDIGVRSGDTGQGVAALSLGRVDVGVSVLNIAKLILSLELAGRVQWGGGNDGLGSKGSNTSTITIGNASSIGMDASSILEAVSIAIAMAIAMIALRGAQVLGLGGGHDTGEEDLK